MIAALRQCILAQYGNWLLVHLPSGRWACVWASALDLDELAAKVLDESWFHDHTPSAATQAEALRHVLANIGREIADTTDAGGKRDYLRESYQPVLERVCAELAQLAKEA